MAQANLCSWLPSPHLIVHPKAALRPWRAADRPACAGDTGSGQGTRHPQDRRGQTSTGTDTKASVARVCVRHGNPCNADATERHHKSWHNPAHAARPQPSGTAWGQGTATCYRRRRRLTSSAASSLESNWQKICSSSFLITLARTFRRPLQKQDRPLATSSASLASSADGDLPPPPSRRGSATTSRLPRRL